MNSIRWKNPEDVWNDTSDKTACTSLHERIVDDIQENEFLMDEFLTTIGPALWLGILTSISPCPLATNIAAISYVGRNAGQSRLVLASAGLYTLGRVVAYSVLGALVVASLLSAPGLSVWLQKYLNLFLGPFLILVGMILLELLELPTGTGSGLNRLRTHVEKLGLAGSGLLGILFALSFCPVSAALFFGSLIPLAIANESKVLLPAVYGIGTGIPVVVFAVMLVFGKNSFGTFFGRVTGAEKWLRRITGISILLVGVYITLQQIYHV